MLTRKLLESITTVLVMLAALVVLVYVVTGPVSAGPEPTWTPTVQPSPALAATSTPWPIATLSATATSAPTNTPTPTDADVAARAGRSVVQVRTASGAGSGVKIERGVLTCEHVVRGTDLVQIIPSDGTPVVAVVARRDARRDLALLLTDAPLPALPLEPSRLQRPGDQVLVLGYPRPDALGGQMTLTGGRISAIREDNTNDRLVVQTDAALNPGNSGGPMVSRTGKLIALACSRVSDSEGLGLGVASETIEAFLAAPPPTATPALPTATPTRVASSAGSTKSVRAQSDEAAFLRQLASALAAGNTWKVMKVEPDYIVVEHADTSIRSHVKFAYTSPTVSRLVIHTIYYGKGQANLTAAALQKINQFNLKYNLTSVAVDSDGDLWFETVVPFGEALDVTAFSDYLKWYTDLLVGVLRSDLGDLLK